VHPFSLFRPSQNASEKFAKVLLKSGGDIEAVLLRLDRLTQEEARMTVTQTLEVVYGLVNNVKLVMDSTSGFLSWSGYLTEFSSADGAVSTVGIREALGMFLQAVTSFISC
jgi:hypothetical protein